MLMDPGSKSDPFWEDPPPLLGGHPGLIHSNNSNGALMQYDRNLNFATVSMDDGDGDYGFQKKKTVRDPLSHRIIEKRRRDRMNNCLADLARLLPQASLRKGRGRIEKTEIVELAIKHLKHLQTHPCPFGDTCEFNPMVKKQLSGSCTSPASSTIGSKSQSHAETANNAEQDDEKFRVGFQDCLSETMHFLIERKGMFAGDALCVQLVQHLNVHCQLLLRQNPAVSDKLCLGHPNGGRDLEMGYFGKTEVDSSISSRYTGMGLTSAEEESSACLTGEKLLLPSAGLIPEEGRPGSAYDYDADNNSCCSTPLSVEISDVYSTEGKHAGSGRSAIKPPVPSIIGSHSGSSAVHSSSNGRSSDEGSASTSETSTHRYKFKNTIKQRFTADLETTADGSGSGSGQSSKWGKHHRTHSHAHHYARPGKKVQAEVTRSNTPTEDPHEQLHETEHRKDMAEDTFFQSESSAEDKEIAWSSMKEKKESHCASLIPVSRRSSVSQAMAEASDLRTLNSGSKGLIVTTTTTTVPSPLPILSVVNMASLTEPEEGEETGAIRFNPLFQKVPEGVPAFALHEKGLFYIPLTLDKALVSPFMAAAELKSPLPPLHPVTISVCFLLNPKDEAEVPEPKFNPDLNSLSLSSSAINLTKFSEPSSALVPFVPSTSKSSPVPHQSTPSSFIMDRFAQASKPGGRSFELPGGERYLLGTLPGPTRYQRANYEVARSHTEAQAGSLHPYNYSVGGTHSHAHTHTHSHSHSLHSTGSSSTSGSTKSSFSTACRTGRKRHLMSPSSSGLSSGYHSWRDVGHSGHSGHSSSTEGPNYAAYLEMESRAEENMGRGNKSAYAAGLGRANKRQKKGRTELGSAKPLNLI